MIAMLTGQVRALTLNSVVIDVNGVGMLVQISPRLGSSLTLGATTTLFTTLIVREDSMNLFGFESISDRELFELLQTVSGIGPKVAQSALSVLDAPELIRAIATEKTAILEKIPGLGKKGAQRVILELKDKVKATKETSGNVDWRTPLHSALTGLGFSSKEIDKLFTQISAEVAAEANEMSASELLKLALQIKGRG